MPTPTKRIIFRLHQPTIESIDKLVEGGLARIKASLVEQLVEQAGRHHR